MDAAGADYDKEAAERVGVLHDGDAVPPTGQDGGLGLDGLGDFMLE